MNVPQLQRDLREVENELRLARNRLLHYETLDEQPLAADARRVVEGLDNLKNSLTTRLQSLTANGPAYLHSPSNRAAHAG